MFPKILKYQKRGFTLVEMMVAIAVFSVVMVTAMSALLNVIDANNKARAIKTAINNVNFALEGISRDMRMGKNYKCSDAGGPFVGDCLGGGDAISFLSKRASGNYIYYKYVTVQINGKDIGRIQSCVSDITDINGTSCNGEYFAVTSAEVDLNKVRFYVKGVEDSLTPAPNRTQPRMIMTVSGTAGPENKASLQTTFDLQTSVSQRIRL